MKKTLTHSSLFALGLVAVTLLTSAPISKAHASLAPHFTLKTTSLSTGILVAGNGGDGQESHGDKGKTHGG